MMDQKKTPVVFHRAIFGSIERFLGVLVEHYAGKFPVWLSPVQVALLPIADRHVAYATTLYNTLQDAGIRVELNTKADTLQAKIRTATLQKVPFMGIIGDKEVSSDNQMSVRTREGKDLGSLELSQFIQQVKQNFDKKI
jgi:threonyl-tRNA synthetase